MKHAIKLVLIAGLVVLNGTAKAQKGAKNSEAVVPSIPDSTLYNGAHQRLLLAS